VQGWSLCTRLAAITHRRVICRLWNSLRDIRRVEKGLHSPTIETLAEILAGIGLNLGLFFEDLTEESANDDAKVRHYHRVLQRALEGPHRTEVIGLLKLIEGSHI